MSGFDFGVFDASPMPAYGSFNLDITGAGTTAGTASDSALKPFLDGARDVLDFFRTTAVEIKATEKQIDNINMYGVGANGVPMNTAVKPAIDPFLILLGVGAWWLVKNA